LSLPNIALVLGSVVALAGLVWIEKRAPAPLIPPKVIAEPVVWRAVFGVLAFAAAMFGVIVDLPLYLQALWTLSPSEAGLLLIPFTLASVAISTWTGLRISATGKPKRYNLAGLLVAAIGCFALAASVGHGVALAVAASVVAGLGLGTTMPAAQTAVQWAAGSDQLGSATASLSFSRSVGGVFGAAIASAVITATLAMLGSSGDLAAALAHSKVAPAALNTAFTASFAALGILAAIGALVVATGPDVDLGQTPIGNR
jgi:MFS family permease